MGTNPQDHYDANTDNSEYTRDLIRRDQARHAENEGIRVELIMGEQSGKRSPSILRGSRNK